MNPAMQQEPSRRKKPYFNIVMVAPSSIGTFVSFTDVTGMLLFCPVEMFDLSQALLDQHPDHHVILEANKSATSELLGSPLFGVHLIDNAGRVTHTVRAEEPRTPNEKFHAYVLKDKEAEDVFMEAFQMTPQGLRNVIQQALENPTKSHAFDVPNTEAYDKTVPQKPTKPHLTLAKPVEHNLDPNSPIAAIVNNRDYATLAKQDLDRAVNEILAAKEAMESIISTGQVDLAVKKSLDLWNAKLTWRHNEEGVPLPYVDKLPLPIALSRRIKAILDECQDEDDLRQLITSVREQGTRQGHTFPTNPWDLLNDPKDLLPKS